MSPKKAVSLIDAVADAGSGSAPCAKRRRLQRASTETIANEVIANNFKPPSKWDAAATHVREVEGKTLFASFCADIREAKKKGMEWKTGKHYLDSYREKYRPESDPVCMLEDFIDESLDIDPKLMRAVAATKRKISDKELMLLHLGAGPCPNITELVGILMFALGSLNVRNDKQRSHCLDAVRFLARHKVDEQFPKVFSVVRPWVDDVLAFVYCKGKATKVKPSAFLKVHADICCLVLPMVAVNHVSQLGDAEFASASEKLIEIVTASELGAAMFGNAMTNVAGQVVENMIQIAFEKWLPNVRVDDAAVATMTQELVAEIEGHAVRKFLAQSRVISFTYRGVQFERRVGSIVAHVSLSVAAHWKGLAVDAGLLEPLWIETLLAFPPPKPNPPTIAESLCLAASMARKSCKEVVAEYGAVTSDVLKELAALRSADFVSLDRDFHVECSVILAVSGAKSGERLISEVGKLLPTENRAGMPETALVNVERLLDKDIFGLATSTAKGQVHVLMKMLSRLVGSKVPDFSVAKDDATLVEFSNQFQFFLRRTTNEDGGNKVVTGKDALQILVAEARVSQADGSLKSPEINQILAYSWLLDTESKAEVKAMAEAIDRKIASKGPARLGKKKQDDESAAAMAAVSVFKRRRGSTPSVASGGGAASGSTGPAT